MGHGGLERIRVGDMGVVVVASLAMVVVVIVRMVLVTVSVTAFVPMADQ